jgi:tetratricopeptide (TPR) repeat protein
MSVKNEMGLEGTGDRYEPKFGQGGTRFSPQSPDDEGFALNKIAYLSKQGYQYLKKNMLEEAELIFSQILETDPDNNYALVGLGDCERKQNRFRDAVQYYRHCLDKHPDNNFALFGIADCYKALNMLPEAIRHWEMYLSRDARNITVLTRVADLHRKSHNFPKSKSLYLQVLDMDPDNAYALIGMGHLHYDFKDYEGALFYWSRILEIAENVADIRVLTSIGNCYRKLRVYDKGIHYFERSLAIESNNFYALFGLADCYRGVGDMEKSITFWNKILDMDPQNKVILTRTGDAYRNSGDLEAAAQYYNMALDIDFDVFALMGLAEISKARGQYEEAALSLSRLIQSEPNNYRLYVDLADCYLQMNRRTEAIAALKQFQVLGVRSQAVNDMLEDINA